MQSTLVQGPLAPIWIAANYEKKLSKQHSLQTDLIATTDVIKTNAQLETITLRVSGQLLLGIVRIYSRKTKYLLDDVNDILYRLKNSFKFASGGVRLGNIGTTHATAEASIIRDLNLVLLQDQVGTHDLLWQEDLHLDSTENEVGVSTFFGDRSNAQDTFDQLIEVGRFGDDEVQHNDVDIELDFDLADGDRSVEVGRNAGIEGDRSLFPELDMGKELDIDLGAPLDIVDDIPEMLVDLGGSPAPEEPATPDAPRPRRTIVGISESGVVRTTKRKLVVDEPSVIDDDLSEMQRLQQIQLSEDNQFVTVQLNEQEKLRLIQELAEPIGFKRRKLWSLDEQLTAVAEQLAQDEPEPEFQDDDLNFDISLPAFEDDIPEINDDNSEAVPTDSINSTKQVSDIIRETNQLTLDEIIDKDTTNESPLGLKLRGDAKYLDMRKQAALSFFELLVLATNDCISVRQDDKIQVLAKDKIFSKFL